MESSFRCFCPNCWKFYNFRNQREIHLGCRKRSKKHFNMIEPLKETLVTLANLSDLNQVQIVTDLLQDLVKHLKIKGLNETVQAG